MVASARKTALVSGLLGFAVVLLVSLFVLGYGLQRGVVSSIPPAIGAAIGVYIANRFVIRNR